MIEIQHVTKCFDNVTALNNVSLTVKDGSVVGLVGSNGAGKSTLLRILAGVYRADSGSVLYDGADVFNNSAVKQHIIFVSDSPYFSSSDTLLSLSKKYKLLYSGWSDESFCRLKAMFSLHDTMKIAKMSKGMQRQAAIILGLSANPKYILFDEIFDGLDPVVRELVKKIFVDFVTQNGASVIIASHNLRELEDVCDTVCLIHSGGILADEDVDKLKLGMTKVQLILEDTAMLDTVRSTLKVVKSTQKGKIAELTLRGDREEILAFLDSFHPVFLELLPLSLEEVFIHEMEVSGYDIHQGIIDA
ncbi:MAG: ABC transporter ATP-binding protein [Clostridia bacterium]|nr:ABC transporter ATP-binding protein [Clostridia bacterium]